MDSAAKHAHADLRAALQRARRQYHAALIGADKGPNQSSQQEQKLFRRSKHSNAKSAQVIDPDCGSALVGPAALDCWRTHWSKHSSESGVYGRVSREARPLNAAAPSGLDAAQQARSTIGTSGPKGDSADAASDQESSVNEQDHVPQSGSSDSGESMHPAGSEEDTLIDSESELDAVAQAAPAAAASEPAARRTLQKFFQPGSSAGFDEAFKATTEAAVDGFIEEATADTLCNGSHSRDLCRNWRRRSGDSEKQPGTAQTSCPTQP